MSETTINKIKSAIESELPAMVGKELQEILAEWEKLKAESPKMKQEIDQLKFFKSEYLHKADGLDQREKDIVTREKAVEKAEFNQKVILLEKELSYVTASRQEIHNLTSTVFNNAKLFEHIHSTKYVQGHTSSTGQWIPDRNESTHTTVEK